MLPHIKKEDIQNYVSVKNVQSRTDYHFAIKPETGENFWDANKQLTYFTPYAQFLKKEGKRRSGRIMTAIWMAYDPKSMAQQSGGREEKEILRDIASNFLNEKNFVWKKYKDIIDAYKMDCLTKIEKELVYWESELKSRRIYQKSLPWDTARKEKDEMLKTQKQLYKDYLEVVKEVKKERTENRYYGNTQKSLLEGQS